MVEELPPPETARLKKRFDAWREAMDRLKIEAPQNPEEEPLFAAELERET
jgi:hypothetical protein